MSTNNRYRYLSFYSLFLFLLFGLNHHLLLPSFVSAATEKKIRKIYVQPPSGIPSSIFSSSSIPYDGSWEYPFLHPQQAIDYTIGKLLYPSSSSSSSTVPLHLDEIHIVFRGGIYRLREPLRYIPTESSREKKKNEEAPYRTPQTVVVRMYPYANEKVIISGTVPLNSMMKITTDDPLYAYIPTETLQRWNILCGSLPTGIPFNFNTTTGGNDGGVSELYWNDVPQVEARWPDNYVANAWATGDPSYGGKGLQNCTAMLKNNTLTSINEPYYCAGWARSDAEENWTWDHISTAPSSSLTPFSNWSWFSKYRIRGYFTYDWAGAESIVDTYIPQNRSLIFTQASWNSAGYWGGNRYYAVGAPEALTIAGEYFVDPVFTQRIYWIAPDNFPFLSSSSSSPSSSSSSMYNLSLSFASSLLILENADNVVIEGLTFTGCTEHCIIINSSSYITIVNTSVTGSGGRAIHSHFDGNHHINISSNQISHTGIDSVWVNGSICQPTGVTTVVSSMALPTTNDDPCDLGTLSPSFITVNDNIIVNTGRLSFAFNPAIGLDGVGSIASHNLILTGPACGIMFGGGAMQQITNNIIIDTLRDTFDMGTVCDGPRDWTIANINITNNALLRNGYTPLLSNHVSDPLRTGLYTDYGNFGHTFANNVVWQPVHPLTPNYTDINRSLPTRWWGVYNHGGRNFNVSNNIFLDIDGNIQANDGGLAGGDKDQLINGSHYYTSLQMCGYLSVPEGNSSGNGWQIPPCSLLLPGISDLDDYVRPNCSYHSSCAPAPYDVIVNTNIGLIFTSPNGTNCNRTFFQGPPEEYIPVTVEGNFLNQDPLFEVGSLEQAIELLDFQIKSTSPAYANGYNYIDMSVWGPRWLTTNNNNSWQTIARKLVPWSICPVGRETGC